MKKISKILKWTFSLALILGFISIKAQEVKPDIIHLTTEEIVKGETIVWDTIIIVTPENENAVNDYLHKKHKGIHIISDKKGGAKIKVKTISGNEKKIQMYIDSDVKVDGKSKVFSFSLADDKLDSDGKVKIVTKKLEYAGESENAIEVFVESDEEGDYEVIWIGDSTDTKTKHKMWINKGDKGKKFQFVVVDGKDGKFNVRQVKDSLKNVLIEFVDGSGGKKMSSKKIGYTFVSSDGKSFTIDSLHEHLNVVKDLEFISEDDNVIVIKDGNVTEEIKVKVHGDLKNIKEKVIYLSKGNEKGRLVFFGDKSSSTIGKLSVDVSDEELSKLGIKTKPDDLKVEDFWLFYYDEKELRLKFSLDTEGKTTIKILDAKGNELFTDKVVYFPGTYDKKIELGSNAGSQIYVYIEQGNASTVKKLSVN